MLSLLITSSKRCFLISLDFLLFSFCICKLGVFLVVLVSFLTQKKHRFSVFLVQLQKQKTSPWGFAQTPSHLRGRRGRWQTYPPTPTVGVGSIQGVKGKMHDFVALTPLHLRGVAKLTEADGAGNLSRLAKQPRGNMAFTGWRRPNFLCGKGAGGFLHPCHVANRVWAAPTVLTRPLGVAQWGKNVP